MSGIVMPPPDSIRVRSENLRTGYLLVHPVLHDSDELLLSAETEITDAIKQCLLDHSIFYVLLHPDDSTAMFASRKRTEAVRPTSKKLVTESSAEATIASASKKIAAELEAFSAGIPTVVENVGPPLKDRADCALVANPTIASNMSY